VNTLTAIRTFGKPSYTPAKRVRIYKDRWYLTTMQNTEHDQGDGYYLADGEYTELVPGAEAKDRRDSRLNHCNRIAEYVGPVWAVDYRYYPSMTYHTTEAEAERIVAERLAELRKLQAEAKAALEKELAKSDAELLAFYGKCKDWPGHEKQQLAKYRQRCYLQLGNLTPPLAPKMRRIR